MTIEEVIDRTVRLQETIEIEYCTRNGKELFCRLTDVHYSNYYGGLYIEAFCTNWGTTRTFKISRIQKKMAMATTASVGKQLATSIGTGYAK